LKRDHFLAVAATAGRGGLENRNGPRFGSAKAADSLRPLLGLSVRTAVRFEALQPLVRLALIDPSATFDGRDCQRPCRHSLIGGPAYMAFDASTTWNRIRRILNRVD